MNTISTFIVYTCAYPFLLCAAEYTNKDIYNYLSYSRCKKIMCTPIIHSLIHKKNRTEECTPFIFTIKQRENAAQKDIKFHYILRYYPDGQIWSGIRCEQEDKPKGFDSDSPLYTLADEIQSMMDTHKGYLFFSPIKYKLHKELISSCADDSTNLKTFFDKIRRITNSYWLADAIKNITEIELCEVDGDDHSSANSPTVLLNELMPTKDVILTHTENDNDKNPEENYNITYPEPNSNVETITQDDIKSFKQRKFNQTIILSTLIFVPFIYIALKFI